MGGVVYHPDRYVHPNPPTNDTSKTRSVFVFRDMVDVSDYDYFSSLDGEVDTEVLVIDFQSPKW